MSETKSELLRKIELLEREEKEKAEEKKKEENYKKFKERKEDWIIGKAHCDIGLSCINCQWSSNRFFTLGDCVSISGNCGTSYNARASVTSATHTYFHNVWSDKQRLNFQKKLNNLACREVTRIMKNPVCVLEILGLQSDDFYLKTIYPKEKVKEIEDAIWQETKKILDRYKIEELKKIKNLSHGNHILTRYLKEKEKATK